jgi:hypothetical protein
MRFELHTPSVCGSVEVEFIAKFSLKEDLKYLLQRGYNALQRANLHRLLCTKSFQINTACFYNNDGTINDQP